VLVPAAEVDNWCSSESNRRGKAATAEHRSEIARLAEEWGADQVDRILAQGIDSIDVTPPTLYQIPGTNEEHAADLDSPLGRAIDISAGLCDSLRWVHRDAFVFLLTGQVPTLHRVLYRSSDADGHWSIAKRVLPQLGGHSIVLTIDKNVTESELLEAWRATRKDLDIGSAAGVRKRKTWLLALSWASSYRALGSSDDAPKDLMAQWNKVHHDARFDYPSQFAREGWSALARCLGLPSDSPLKEASKCETVAMKGTYDELALADCFIMNQPAGEALIRSNLHNRIGRPDGKWVLESRLYGRDDLLERTEFAGDAEPKTSEQEDEASKLDEAFNDHIERFCRRLGL